MRPGAVVALLYWVSPTPSHVTRLGRPCPGDICTCICCVIHMLAACSAAPREIGTCLLRFHTCGCVPTDHCCGVTRLSAPPRMPSQSWPFSSQEGGTLQDGARSAQCTRCHFAACVGVAAGSQPAATLLCHVCCVAHAHVSQPPQPTRHAVVCGLHIVSMASRAELCIKRHSTKTNKKTSYI